MRSDVSEVPAAAYESCVDPRSPLYNTERGKARLAAAASAAAADDDDDAVALHLDVCVCSRGRRICFCLLCLNLWLLVRLCCCAFQLLSQELRPLAADSDDALMNSV